MRAAGVTHTLAYRYSWLWRALCALLAYQLTAAPLAFALPRGPQVVGGAATLSQDGTTLQITQGTSKAIINWSGFSIGSNELVRFIQPGSTAIALNRVVGGETSQILGQLLANGRIFLINPNGIIFGAGAQVNVGSLLATTLSISDADFMAGNYIFRRESGNLSTIVNLGTLRAADGGFIALSAPGVVNQGTITARLGTVHLSSAERLTVDFSGDGLVRFAVNGAIAGVPLDSAGQPLAARVSNEGRISADGGEVTLTARAVADVLTRVVNNSGVIEARSLVDRGGVVSLIGGDDAMVAANANGAVRPAGQVAGAVTNTGTIDVSAAVSGAAPGLVVMLGERVGQMGTIDARGARPGARRRRDPHVHRGHDALRREHHRREWARQLRRRPGLGVVRGPDHRLERSADPGARRRGGRKRRLHRSVGQGRPGLCRIRGRPRAAGQDRHAPARSSQYRRGDGGAAALTAVDQFTDTPAADLTIAPAAINAAGALVVLQANNDITFTNAVAIAGAGIGLTAQAGRSIIINANVATNNAPISLTANETTANGVQNANRDVGPAAITMAAGTSLSSGGANITVTMNTGAGLTNSTSGNITLEGVNAGAGHVLVVNNGPTAGSGIVRTSANELITATSAALDVNGAGGGGGIGTLAAPMRVSVTNLEARSQSGGAFFTSPTLPVNIGGAALGGLTGISTSSNGAISVTTTGTSITTSEAISANGTGTVTLTAAGAASSITANDAISSGSGAIALTAANGITLSGANADVTTTGAYTANADSDSNGTGAYAQNNAGSAVSSGAVTITAQDIDLQGTVNAGATNVLLRPGAAATTIGVADASKQFNLTDAELSNITTTGTVTVGIATNTGGITIGTDGAINQNKALTFLSTGNIVLAANGLTDAGAVTMTTSGTGAITLNGPLATTGNKNIALTTTNAPITTTGTINAGGSGTVTVTAAGAVNGSVTVNNAISSGSGAIALTATNGITLSGANADVTTTGAYTANADSDSNGTGAYAQNNAGSAVTSGAVTITAQDIDLQGTVNAGATNVLLRPGAAATTIGVADASKQFNLTDAELSNITTTGTVTIGIATNTGGITIGTDGAINQNKALTFLSTGNIVLAANGLTDAGAVTMTTSGTGAITLNGPLATTGNKNIALTTTNAPITTTGTINAGGSGTVTLTAAGAVNGSVTVSNAISSGTGAIALTAANGITLSGANADVTTTGAYTANADSDSNGTGAYAQNNAGSAVSSGAVTITAQDIDLQGTVNAGAAAVTLRPGAVATTIGVEDASKQFSLTNAELSNITTTGTVTIGQNTNTGGITIGTDAAINQTKRLDLYDGRAVEPGTEWPDDDGGGEPDDHLDHDTDYGDRSNQCGRGGGDADGEQWDHALRHELGGHDGGVRRHGGQ